MTNKWDIMGLGIRERKKRDWKGSGYRFDVKRRGEAADDEAKDRV
jgi:hypothetical protein